MLSVSLGRTGELSMKAKCHAQHSLLLRIHKKLRYGEIPIILLLFHQIVLNLSGGIKFELRKVKIVFFFC